MKNVKLYRNPEDIDTKILKNIGIGTLIVATGVALFYGVKKYNKIQREENMTRVITKYGDLIFKYANQYGVDPHLVASVFSWETRGLKDYTQVRGPINWGYEKQVLTWTDGEKWKNHRYYNMPDIFNRAYGPMQIMYPLYLSLLYSYPAYFTAVPQMYVLYDVENGIKFGTQYLKWCIDFSDGDINKAIKKYGEGTNSYLKGVLAMYNDTSKDIWNA